MKLTVSLIMSLGPCPEWPWERVEGLLDTYGGEVEHTVLLRDPRVSADDLEWLGLQLLKGDDALLRRYACECVDMAFKRKRASGQEPDPQSLAAVEVARRYARGHATDEELCAAHATACAAESAAWETFGNAEQWSIIRFATGATDRSAAKAAEWTASAAVVDAGHEWDAERELQVGLLIKLLNEKEEHAVVV